MRPTPPRSKARATAGAFLTLLAIGLLAPASTRADCRHPSDRPSIAIGIDGPGADAPSDDPRPAPPPKKPCDGPQCSGKSAPPITPSPPVPPRAEAWGLAVEPAPAPPPNASPRAAEDAPARPVRLATSLFRPPRLPR